MSGTTEPGSPAVRGRKGDAICRTLLESAAEGIIIVDENGRIVLANARVLELFGYGSDDLIGQPVEVLVPDRLREAHVGLRNRYMADPRNRSIGEGLDLYGRKRDGSEVPLEISLSHAVAVEGLLVMAMISDISGRKHLEEAKSQLMERRIAELEKTLHALEKIARPPVAAVTARLMGVFPLQESAPELFRELTEAYARIMEESLDRRIYKIEGELSGKIDELGSRLGFLGLTPRDVVDLHSAILREKAKSVPPARMKGYIEEGHFVLIELLGRVTTFYRDRAIGIKGAEVQRSEDVSGRGEEDGH
jgi:PAS domain S-box-containing protein